MQKAEVEEERAILSREDIRLFFQNKFGPFFTVSLFDELDNDDCDKIHDVRFMEIVLEGMNLRKRPDLNERQVVRYEEELHRRGYHHAIPWLIPWMRATYLYRQDKHLEAFERYRDAFEKGRYSAGRNQYKLVNQYIEACAK